MCGEGPWKSLKALSSHKVRKHAVRNPVQSTACPHCGRKFSCKTAAQRHVKKRSCGRPVTNHGQAGALAGQRLTAGVEAQAPVERASPRQSTLDAFFVNHAGPRLFGRASSEPLCSPAEAASSRASWEPAAEHGEEGGRPEPEASASVPAGLRPRPDPQRVGGLVDTNLHPLRRRRVGYNPCGAHDGLEGAASTQRASSSTRTGEAHGRSRLGQVASSVSAGQ